MLLEVFFNFEGNAIKKVLVDLVVVVRGLCKWITLVSFDSCELEVMYCIGSLGCSCRGLVEEGRCYWSVRVGA